MTAIPFSDSSTQFFCRRGPALDLAGRPRCARLSGLRSPRNGRLRFDSVVAVSASNEVAPSYCPYPNERCHRGDLSLIKA